MTLVYWRDIPAQVVVQRGRTRAKVLLSARFQDAIDRAAMRAGKGGSSAYLAEWRRVTTACASASAPDDLARQEAQRLEAAYCDRALADLVRRHGVRGG